MQTNFSVAQLADPDTNASEKILRACVHCGFCTATCPTYVLLGDELDSPRGRIYLIKDMLENDRPATPEVVKHIDRCLSCLSCMTTCPSGVNYMHLVDHARQHIEKTYKRPWFDRLLRRAFGIVLPNPKLFRASMWLARLGAPFAGLLPAQLKAALALVPSRLPSASVADKPQVFKSQGRGPVALRSSTAARNRFSRRRSTRRRSGFSRAMAATSSSPPARDAAARSPIISARTRTSMRAPTFWPGRKRSPAADSMRSSSTHRDAARRSRTMASCSATIPNSRSPPGSCPR